MAHRLLLLPLLLLWVAGCFEAGPDEADFPTLEYLPPFSSECNPTEEERNPSGHAEPPCWGSECRVISLLSIEQDHPEIIEAYENGDVAAAQAYWEGWETQYWFAVAARPGDRDLLRLDYWSHGDSEDNVTLHLYDGVEKRTPPPFRAIEGLPFVAQKDGQVHSAFATVTYGDHDDMSVAIYHTTEPTGPCGAKEHGNLQVNMEG